MLGYLVSLMIFTATFALFSLGLNLQWGFTGLINFGHIAFMTVGAYATVLLSSAGMPLILAVAIGAVLAAGLGLFIGFSTLRLREDYLAIVTIGVSEIVRLIALNEEWLTRGTRGVYGYPLPFDWLTRPTLLTRYAMIALWTAVFALAGWHLWQWSRSRLTPLLRFSTLERSQKFALVNRLVWAVLAAVFALVLYIAGATALYDYSYKAGLMLLLVLVLALVYWRLEWLARSPWGRVLKAIREDEEVPKALGKNVFWYKLQALMLGGAIAGIAGSFYAWQLTFINPDGFIPLVTFQAWTIVVLGGAGSNAGTLLGAAIFWAYNSSTRFIPDLLRFLHTILAFVPANVDEARLGAFRIMVIGLLLVILMMVRPQGILGKKEELTLGR